jgi:hypothetical protein
VRVDWRLGLVVGAMVGLGIVWLYASGAVGWQWLLAGPPLVLLGGLCGVLVEAWRA